jgi:hypothetical protein
MLFVAVAVTIIAVIVLCRLKEPFDNAGWRSRDSEVNGVKQRMAADLVSRQSLEKKDRAEVEDLLGAPDVGTSEPDWLYLLGPERTLNPFSAGSRFGWLEVHFGDDGRVHGVQILSSSNSGSYTRASKGVGGGASSEARAKTSH